MATKKLPRIPGLKVRTYVLFESTLCIYQPCSLLILLIEYFFYTTQDVDWINLEWSRPPSAPTPKDLCALRDSKLGLFLDETDCKAVLTDEDQARYAHWDFVCKTSFEHEVVELLVSQEPAVSYENCAVVLY